MNILRFRGEFLERSSDKSFEKGRETLRISAVGPGRNNSRGNRQRIHRLNGGCPEFRLVKDGDIPVNCGASGRKSQSGLLFRFHGFIRSVRFLSLPGSGTVEIVQRIVMVCRQFPIILPREKNQYPPQPFPNSFKSSTEVSGRLIRCNRRIGSKR